MTASISAHSYLGGTFLLLQIERFKFKMSDHRPRLQKIYLLSFSNTDLQELEGRTPLLEPGITYHVPMLPITDIVVCPGDIFPLRITESRLRLLVNAAMQAPAPVSRLLALVTLDRSAEISLEDSSIVFDTIGCIVEIIKQSSDGVCLLTQGRQRMEFDFKNSSQPIDFQRIAIHVLPDTIPTALPFAAHSNQAAWPNFVYQRGDARSLAKVAIEHFNQLVPHGEVTSIYKNDSPIDLSFWLLGNLPFNAFQRKALFQAETVVERLAREIELMKEMEHIYCYQCSHPIANVKSDLVQINDEGIGGHFVNSHGALHDMLTLKNARVRIISEPEVENSWFPGFAWQIAYCEQCREHLGWYFTSVDQGRSEQEQEAGKPPRSFFGLRTVALDNLDKGGIPGDRAREIFEMLLRQAFGNDGDNEDDVNSEEDEDSDSEEEDEDGEGSSEWETESGSEDDGSIE
jgi:Lon protease-like protein